MKKLLTQSVLFYQNYKEYFGYLTQKCQQKQFVFSALQTPTNFFGRTVLFSWETVKLKHVCNSFVLPSYLIIL